MNFQSHGGLSVASLVLQTCIDFGARLANSGEYSKRAFLNDKIDLTQAQAISKIIEAKSQNAVKLLARQLKGELSQFVDEIKKDLVFILAYVEVTIDYSEDDLPKDILEQIDKKLIKIDKKLTNTLISSKTREGLIDGFKVAIIGKPNVGKSSLLNKLLNNNRAIVSQIAGTTRDTIEENIKIGTHIIKIIDTAGIRNSTDAIEKIGIKKTLQTINDADIIIALFDNNSKFDNEDKQILKLLNDNKNNKKEQITIITKDDLKNNFDEQKLTNLKIKPIKLNTKEDISCLIDLLEDILNKNNQNDDIVLISTQQINEVQQTLLNIKEAYPMVKKGEFEFFAYHINEALKHISNITKPYEHSQMLDVMFGEFCLGK